MKKKKIFNDPIYGFIEVPSEFIFSLIEHPYFQRLRRIRQLGLTHLVYPGALHTRFHHALGSMHLAGEAINVLRSKGHEIDDDEAEAVTAAILLHDIGHTPFSHSLEGILIPGVNHEEISLAIMKKLDVEFSGKLSMAINIFQNNYKKKFLHQLVSSQLDMDRLDYLNRDSFYSGVSEGIISSHRLITMLDIVDDKLVIEAKGVYSVEKFIIARRLMYWQVYLHKTVISAEQLLVNILLRAKELSEHNFMLFAPPSLSYFLKNKISKTSFNNNTEILERFTDLDDHDISSAIKVWAKCEDKVLSRLCSNMVNRVLYKTIIQQEKFDVKEIEELKRKINAKYDLRDDQIKYFVFSNHIVNNAYSTDADKINILFKNGDVADITKASDNLNISVLSSPVTKYFLCHPKDIS